MDEKNVTLGSYNHRTPFLVHVLKNNTLFSLTCLITSYLCTVQNAQCNAMVSLQEIECLDFKTVRVQPAEPESFRKATWAYVHLSLSRPF